MESTSHEAIISTITTLYNLLADQALYDRSNILNPTSPGQIFGEERISSEGALEHGFSSNVVNLLRRIPYLENSEYQIAYETCPLRYLDEDEGPFDYARDPSYQERTDLMSSDDAVLTGGQSPYGANIIYNVKEGTVKEWFPFGGPDHPSECPAFSMDSPENPLYRIIARFLTLKSFHVPGGGGGPQLYRPNTETGVNPNTEGMDDEERQHWQQMKAENEAQASFRTVFLESGWDPGAAERELRGILNTDPPVTSPDPGISQQMASARIASSDEAIWRRLERARLAAKANFRVEEFERRSESWVAAGSNLQSEG